MDAKIHVMVFLTLVAVASVTAKSRRLKGGNLSIGAKGQSLKGTNLKIGKIFIFVYMN